MANLKSKHVVWFQVQVPVPPSPVVWKIIPWPVEMPPTSQPGEAALSGSSKPKLHNSRLAFSWDTQVSAGTGASVQELPPSVVVQVCPNSDAMMPLL